MKTNLQILYLLKEVYERPDYDTDGMCVEVLRLCGVGVITNNERDKIIRFIDKNEPRKIHNTTYRDNHAYWWIASVKHPRIEWINTMIKQGESKKKKP